MGGNDNSVLGAIRALEGHRFRADSAIGVGINGTEAVAEFQKKNKTAFIATILLNARQHGYDTAKSMFLWIRDGKSPENHLDGGHRHDPEELQKPDGIK